MEKVLCSNNWLKDWGPQQIHTSIFVHLRNKICRCCERSLATEHTCIAALPLCVCTVSIYRFVFFCPGYQSIRWIHCDSLPFLSGMQDSHKGFWKCDYVSIYLQRMDRERSACTLNIFNNRKELFNLDRHEKYISQMIASVWVCSAWDKQECTAPWVVKNSSIFDKYCLTFSLSKVVNRKNKSSHINGWLIILFDKSSHLFIRQYILS